MFRSVWPEQGRNGPGGVGGNMEHVVIDGVLVDDTDETSEQQTGGARKSAQMSRPRIIFRAPTFDKGRTTNDEKPSSSSSMNPSSLNIHRDGPSSPLPSPSPRTMLLIACMIALAQASPLKPAQLQALSSPAPTPLETAGTLLSWLSTILYLGSRLPQLWKNYCRKSTGGLSPYLFLAAFCGNLAYSAALLTNPNAWSSMPPYGGAGWAGPDGNDRQTWVAAALPFFLGAAGVLALDASMGVQFVMYGGADHGVVVVQDQIGAGHSRWRRVSGWMRGWVPSFSEPKGQISADEVDEAAERRGLLSTGEARWDDRREGTYGTVSR
nr:putative vacuolar amino acid transporter ypq2 [Quercus suber]